MMTKRDFEAFAHALRYSAPMIMDADEGDSQPEVAQWRDDVKAVANVLAASNGRFDRERFYRAAGYES